jgi:hypothetical protein
VHKRTLFRVQREECQGEDTYRVVEHSVSSTRSALSRSFQEGTYIPLRNKGTETSEVRAVEAHMKQSC